MLSSLVLLACAPRESADPAPEVQDSGTPDDSGADSAAPNAAAWTFVVWMDGDNDLETYVLHDINELEAGLPGDDLQVLAVVDRVEGYDDADGDWTGTRLYRIRADDDPDVVKSEVLEDLGEVDMGDPAALSSFLLRVHAEWPAERYALALWNHGSGWYADDTPAPPGVAWDETSQSEIGIADGELAGALDGIVAARGPIDVVAFDACNMAGFEVAHALRRHATALVAAPSWVGGEGLQYSSALAALTVDPSMDAVALADRMARDTVEIGQELSYAAIRLDALDGLASAVDALAGVALDDVVARERLVQGRADSRPVEIGAWKNSYIDIGELVAVTDPGDDTALSDALAALEAARAEAVIGSYGSGRLDWNTGITVFFDTYDLESYVQQGATWSEATRWDELLVNLRDGDVSAR